MQALTAVVIALLSQNFCGIWMGEDVNVEGNFTFRQVKSPDWQRSSPDNLIEAEHYYWQYLAPVDRLVENR